MAQTLLDIHLILRWLVLALIFLGVAFQLLGFRTRSNPRQKLLAILFVSALDLQLLLGVGIILAGSSASESGRHLLLMGTAVAVAHILRIREKRAVGDAAFRLGTLLYVLPMVLIIVGLRLG